MRYVILFLLLISSFSFAQKLKAKEELVEEISIHGAAWADGIMKVIIESDNMYNFVKRWREHFVKHMSPQYLPKYWSIDSPLEKSGKVEI